MRYDNPLSDAEVAQIASQAGHVSLAEVRGFEHGFVGDQSDDFYAGLLAGYMACYAVATQWNPPQPDLGQFFGKVAALVASKMVERR